MKIASSGLFVASTLLGQLAWPSAAFALDDAEKAAARELSTEAKVDYDESRFADAAQKFQKAYDIAKVPTLAVWAARSLVMRGQLVAASELYRQASQLSPNELWMGNAQQEAQSDAARELAALIPRIPRIRVHIEGASSREVEVTVNGVKLLGALVDVDRLTDPGHWTIVGLRGTEKAERIIDLKEGERMDVMLSFQSNMLPTNPITVTPRTAPSPAVQPSAQNSTSAAQRQWGWIATGVGAAGLLTGATAGIIVASKHSSLNCANDVCDPSKVNSSSVNSYNTWRTVSTVSLIVGGVSAAAGVTLLLTSPQPKEAGPTVGLWLGAQSAGAYGRF